MTTVTTKATLLVAAAVLALSSCKHDGAATSATPGQPRPRITSPAIADLFAAIPGNAFVLGFLDLEEAPWSFITGGGPLPLDEANRKALDKELREYVERYLGLDPSGLQYAVGFVSGPPWRGAVVLKTVKGALKMPGASDYEGAKVWLVDPASRASVAIRGNLVVFGENAAVRDVLDTLAGKRKAVTADNAPLVDWLRKETPGAVLGFAAIRPKDLPLPPPLSGAERAAMSIGASGVSAAVEGDSAAISSLEAMSDRAFATMLSQAEKAHDTAVAGTSDPFEGAMAIISAAYARSYAARLKPRRTGNRLSASLDLGLAGTATTMVVPMIGIVAAVAIPAFMDYMKRSKKTEAALQLNKIGKNAKRAYAETSSFVVGTAAELPRKPGGGGCCGGTATTPNHCRADPAGFAADSVWRGLDFQIDEDSLFYYDYTGTRTSFTAKATGDLDCDGTEIVYTLHGTVVNGVPQIQLIEPAVNAD